MPGFRYAAFAFLLFSARNLAHRNFVALEIFAHAAGLVKELKRRAAARHS
jgi:hypothetical protein